MPNRSYGALPAVYADTTSDWDIVGASHRNPYALDIFDVTFLHFHNTLELGLCVSGEGICYVEDREYPFSTGDVQIIFPFQRHLSKSQGPECSRWYWINLDPMRVLLANGFTESQQVGRWLHREMGLCGILHRKQYPRITELTEQIIQTDCGLTDEHIHRNQYLCASLYLLILELCEASRSLPPLPLRTDARFDALLPALDRVRTDLENNIKPAVSTLAGLCGMSAATFRRVFTKTIGLPPRDYILSSSMRKARQLLLTTDSSILEIGLSTGFEDISGFNRCFSSHVGMTPSEYRREYGKD